MPNCRVCKQPLTDGSRFCGQCGASVDVSAPFTRTSLPSSKKPNMILVLIITVLSVALVAVSLLKTGAIPIPWTQKPQTPPTTPPISTVQPVLRSPSLPYTLSCTCKTPDFTLTIKKIVVIPEAEVQVWIISLQGIAGHSVIDSLPFFYLQDLSSAGPSYQPLSAITTGYNCPISLDQGQTIVKAILFSGIPPVQAQYRLTAKYRFCGGDSDLAFVPVTFTFS